MAEHSVETVASSKRRSPIGSVSGLKSLLARSISPRFTPDTSRSTVATSRTMLQQRPEMLNLSQASAPSLTKPLSNGAREDTARTHSSMSANSSKACFQRQEALVQSPSTSDANVAEQRMLSARSSFLSRLWLQFPVVLVTLGLVLGLLGCLLWGAGMRRALVSAWEHVSDSKTFIIVVGVLAAYPYSATCVTVAAIMRFGCSMQGLRDAATALWDLMPCRKNPGADADNSVHINSLTSSDNFKEKDNTAITAPNVMV